MFTGIICTLVIFSVCSRVSAKMLSIQLFPVPHFSQMTWNLVDFPAEQVCLDLADGNIYPGFRWKNTTKASLLYLCILTLTIFRCCDKSRTGLPVRQLWPRGSDDDQAIECNSGHIWFHIQCQGIGDDTCNNLLNETLFSRNCITWDHTNFSHSSKSSSLASGNSFSTLSDSSESDRSHCKSLQHPRPDVAYDRTSSMKILSINCQSIINKRSEFQSVLDLEKPDLVIGTESWLNTDHLDSEIFPRSLDYTSFQDQDQDLVKRRNDSHSPGPVVRELVHSSHQRSEHSNAILCIFSRWDQRIG